MKIELKTIENANPLAKELLEQAKKEMGMIPNLYLAMANNPSLLDSYVKTHASYRKNSGLTPQEQEVVLLSASYVNGCEYCMAAHSFIADKMSKVPTEVTDAIRNNTEISDSKFSALSNFTKSMVESNGYPEQDKIDAFFKAGYNEKDVAGVLTGVALKTMSNYFNHMFKTPVDSAFQGQSWTKK